MENKTGFEVESSVDIAASPAAVWDAVAHMNTIREPPPLLFRLGVAYPLRGEMLGEGVGATRHGVFSTGIAVERVTVWNPDRELAFEVLDEPPSIIELSPYETVHAPHVRGYFQTSGGSFRMVPLPDGRTRLVEHTTHSVRLAPEEYWLAVAKWIVRQNHARVLEHISREAPYRAPRASPERRSREFSPTLS